ncbi:hypothetical protein DCS_05207 [Drechmeria coniospora]|uniref:Uncharacterized protein n=1 Tax=Drechmeria coniospora TaxID=98403 RepID=A0A151GM48_DRECN|nr:hypothetical protein DCS_05207 [Drechmeria coniospora]KYK58194.1 hypothetical protein DCS_05207 [Drechmeria coniospora]
MAPRMLNAAIAMKGSSAKPIGQTQDYGSSTATANEEDNGQSTESVRILDLGGWGFGPSSTGLSASWLTDAAVFAFLILPWGKGVRRDSYVLICVCIDLRDTAGKLGIVIILYEVMAPIRIVFKMPEGGHAETVCFCTFESVTDVLSNLMAACSETTDSNVDSGNSAAGGGYDDGWYKEVKADGPPCW